MKPAGQKWFAAAVMLLFLLPNLYFAAVGGENYPFTCAPMFAHYLPPDASLYSFKFVGEFAHSERVLPARMGKITEIGTMRFFFGKVYGSCDDFSPFGNHPNDTPQLFEERLSRYFQRYLAVLQPPNQSDVPQIRRVRLEVWRFNKDNVVEEKRIIGYYSTATQRFTHTWKRDK